MLKNLKNLLGTGPLILLSFLILESGTIYLENWIQFRFTVSNELRIILILLCLVLMVIGMIWFNHSLNLIRVNFLGGENKLVITGPFCYVRHPLYAMLIFFLPLIIIIGKQNLLFIVPWIFLYYISHYLVKIEERKLLAQFGDDYCQYCKYVPALVPINGAAGKKYREEIQIK